METVAAKLEAARQELLDLGLRNPLLNFRVLRARGVAVVAERPFPIYTHLVTNEKPMGFLSTDDGNEDELGQPDITATFVANHDDDQLQTPYSDTDLQKRLWTTYFVAREYIEEQGVNVLYLALGMLHWIDRSTPGVVRRAPLILIPVELFRADAASRFRIRYTGADWGDNLPLRTKLAQDFDLDLPLLPPGNNLDFKSFFAEVRHAIRSELYWSVDDTAVSLGFFSFSKFLMYHDLDPAHWQAAHPVVNGLLMPDGLTQPCPQLDDDVPIDSYIDLVNSHQVVDADSSQTLAILDVNAGHNLVIQGPPGTGKSQTITNLIAEAVGQGKKVLFVAEKMAALDVVKRRMDEVGLGDVCLELHSHKSTKRIVAAELARTLKQGQPKENGRFSNLSTLQNVRDHLNSYSHAINDTIGRSETTLYEAYGGLLQLRAKMREELSIANCQLSIAKLSTWSADEFDERVVAARGLQRCLVSIGVPVQHALWGTQRVAAPEELPSQLAALANSALKALRQVQVEAEKLAVMMETANSTALSAGVPLTFTDLTKLIFAAQRLQIAPQLYGIEVDHAMWQTAPDVLLDALNAGQRISEAQETYQSWLIPEAWSQDVLAIRQGLMVGRSRWRRAISGKYRKARDQLAGLCRSALPETWESQVGAVDAILDVQREQPLLDAQVSQLQAIFGLRWQGLDSNWSDLRKIADWLINIHESIKQNLYPASMLQLAAKGVDKPALEKICAAIADKRKQYESAFSALRDHLQFDPARRFGPKRPFISLPIADQQAWLTGCHAAANTIGEMAAYNRQVRETAVLGLQSLVDVAHQWPAADAHLTNLLLLARYEALVDRAQAERAALQGHYSQHPDETIAQFQELDTQFLRHNRIRLAHEHWQQLPRYEAGGTMGLLQHECNKKSSHLPIRQLMTQAGHAVQRIKPVFMMSPLSIAAYLPPGSVQFDLVIFDEASQVRPVDAFGAILRGKQVVVVGDNRQLPPTTFFERLVSEKQADGLNLAASLVNQESILDLFLARSAPERMLRWHYRSRHESLIAVSNQEFYARKLVVFPSPDAERRDVGLRYHYLPDTAYQRGGSRTNPQEADAVAAVVMQHAAEQPQLTLGVVAFSRGQRQVIRQRVEQLRRENPVVESFFRAHPTEPFFVKNLENVQGDERDVILISVGYGRSADGKLTMNFGPINQEGGERRLNVLITRARRRCEIFTNLTADDIDLRRTDARGVVALKRYLQFAQTGEMGDLPPETSSVPARFEDVLAAELRAQGFEVAQRVGTGPVRVDVAVVGGDTSTRLSGRYRLGIECDGDNYFLARSARDRDRIQSQVLARLGWRIHRVWSQQWWHDPVGEREKLLAVLNRAETDEVMSIDEPFELARYDERLTLAEPRPVPAYSRYAGEISLGKSTFYDFYSNRSTRKVNRPKLLKWMGEIVRAESPIHVEELRRRMSHAAGYQMMTLPEDVAHWIVNEGRKLGLINVRDEFLYEGEGKRPLVRDRSSFKGVSRKFGYIAPEEIEEAVLLVVQDALGIALDEVPKLTARLLGFHQVGGKSKDAIVGAVERLVRNGRLVQQNGLLFEEKGVS